MVKLFNFKMICKICQTNQAAEILSVCRDCIINDSKNYQVRELIEKAHIKSRQDFHLVVYPPRNKNGIECNICINRCKIENNATGYCMIRKNIDGKLKSYPVVEYYYDSLPTNCVAAFTCAGCSNCGFPKYSYKEGIEYGYNNLAVFYGSCSFNCLFCQNWHYRYCLPHYRGNNLKYISEEELASAVKEDTSCICYFGGDPTCSLTHAIKTSRLAIDKNKGRILRICFETNGSMSHHLLDTIAELALTTGGCIKFDLKAYNKDLHYALCGVSNENTLSNFKYLSKYIKERKEVPFLIASTLLVPLYITEEEIYNIATFIKNCDENIPYSLLAFYPHFYMKDIGFTSKRLAYGALRAAEAAGLKNINIGNLHLLK